ncbi:MAG: glycerate kinase [Alphaproteobacteria bacterium]|nr:glycerate kinase [Alphaproteobacteria bacterium]
MNILVACDSFKDALPADAVCRAIAAGLKKNHPGATVSEMPLSDGGEGLLDVLGQALALKWIEIKAADPLGREVMARYGVSADGITAVVELPRASGLQLLTLAERDPLKTSTYGTGQLLADARARGAKRALLAIGGSATNDAGIGAAAALGWRFLNANNQPVAQDGGHLKDIVRLVSAEPPFQTMDVLCDVTNPLFGPRGAAWVYGRQKGGNDAGLAELDDGLKHIAEVVKAQTGRDVAQMPGAGAAGGLGYGAVAFLGAQLRRGIEVVLDITGFEAAAARADLIITGEGHLDGQSAQGKLIQGLCGRSGGKPVIALCGKLSASPEEIRAIGLKAAYSINREERPLAEMLANTAVNLEKTAASLAV